MTERQDNHLDKILERFSESLIPKYEAGALEHKGQLWDRPVTWIADQAIDEALDQFVYLTTLQDLINKLLGVMCEDCHKKLKELPDDIYHWREEDV